MSDINPGAAPPPTTDEGPHPGATATRIVKSVAETAKQEAGHLTDSVRQTAQHEIERRKGSAGEALDDFAQAIRKAGEELDQRERGMPSRMLQQAAEGVEGLAGAVRQKRPEELVGVARDFARRNPVPFAAGAMLAGFALARFLRSSAEPEPVEFPQASASGVRPQPSGSEVYS